MGFFELITDEATGNVQGTDNDHPRPRGKRRMEDAHQDCGKDTRKQNHTDPFERNFTEDEIEHNPMIYLLQVDS